MVKWIVEASSDDLALTASIIREHGHEMKLAGFKVQGDQCLRIAEALCNARSPESLEDEEVGEKLQLLRHRLFNLKGYLEAEAAGFPRMPLVWVGEAIETVKTLQEEK